MDRPGMQKNNSNNELANKDITALFRQGFQHFKAGRLQQAKHVCLRVLQQQQHPGTILVLALVAHQKNEFEEAVERYQQFLHLDPRHPQAHSNLGLVFKELGRTELAIEHFNKSIAIAADNAAVFRELADAYSSLQRWKEAIEPYQQALAMEPDDVVTIIKLAGVLHGLQRWAQSIPWYEQAAAIQPDNTQVLRNLGVSHQQLSHKAEAIKCFEQVLKLQPDYIDARIKLAQVLAELGRAQEALNQLEQAVELNPDYTEAHIELAGVLKDLGQPQLAIEHLERHLSTQPSYSALYFHIAMIKPQQAHIPLVEQLLSDSKLPRDHAIYCHFTLGYLFQDGKCFDQAFAHFQKANALYRGTFSYDPKRLTRKVDGLIKTYSKRFFQRKSQLGSASDLPVFIVGMPRSGTTLVEQIISSHPQVYGAGELRSLPSIETSIAQELKYANPYPQCMSLMDRTMAEKYSASHLQELALQCSSAQRIIDKLPSNFSKIGLIKILFPKARIIHCQRNPLDNCISLFFHYFVGLKSCFEMTELGHYYLEHQRLMSHWQSLFPGEIFSLQYEDLVMEQEKTSKQLVDYLGLAWDENCINFHNNQRVVRTVSNIQVRQPIYQHSVDRWKHYEKHLQPLIEVLQQAL
jgi:tetratricopeptide (TPR) repeat protein